MVPRLRYHAWYLWWIISFTYNVAVLSLVLSNHLTNKANSIMVAVNILITVLIRNEPFLHLLYYLVVKGSREMRNSSFKRVIHRMLHMNGDLHVSSAIWAVVWLSLYLYYSVHNIDSRSITLISAVILMLLIMIMSAQRYVRHRCHNIFELIHRYVGWSLLVVFLVMLIYLHIGNLIYMLFDPTFILYVIIVCTVLSPWFFVRRVDLRGKVNCTEGVVILTLPGAPKAGTFVRLSHNLIEWHAFSIASRSKNEEEYEVIIAPAGDWTKDLLDQCNNSEQPKYIWIRTILSPGFMRSVMAYRKVLCIGTGGGIAPILSFLANTDHDHVHILWIAKQFESYYGASLVELLSNRSNTVLWDTGNGRPNTFDIVKDYCNDQDIDAVFIVSNQKLTFQLVHDLSQDNIISYGAVWDS